MKSICISGESVSDHRSAHLGSRGQLGCNGHAAVPCWLSDATEPMLPRCLRMMPALIRQRVILCQHGSRDVDVLKQLIQQLYVPFIRGCVTTLGLKMVIFAPELPGDLEGRLKEVRRTA
jgi:hypothetical protein